MVEIKFAKLKSIPVVTATCPRRLNLNKSKSVIGVIDCGSEGFLPASDPGEEGGFFLRRQHVSPEVGTSRGRYRGEDLCHAGADDECCRWSVEVQID